jgi:hypothetical protein
MSVITCWLVPSSEFSELCRLKQRASCKERKTKEMSHKSKQSHMLNGQQQKRLDGLPSFDFARLSLHRRFGVHSEACMGAKGRGSRRSLCSERCVRRRPSTTAVLLQLLLLLSFVPAIAFALTHTVAHAHALVLSIAFPLSLASPLASNHSLLYHAFSFIIVSSPSYLTFPRSSTFGRISHLTQGLYNATVFDS